MKKIIIALGIMMFAVVIPCAGQYSRSYSRHYGRSQRSYADLVEIFVTSPGTLQERMPKDMHDRVRVLRIEGPLNESDFRYINKLAKRSKVIDEQGKEISNYLDVDLELARIEEKGLFGANHDVLARGAFQYATHLRSVVLPERLKSIGSDAFASCYNLEEVVMPPRVYEFGDRAFESCGELRYFTVPSSLETIGKECFKGCTELRTLPLPSSVTYIGKNAFDKCGLTELGIPSRCEIENDNPGVMEKLQSIEVERGNTRYSSIDYALYDKNGSILLLYPAARNGECRLPSGLQAIASYAFYKAKITAIDIPESVNMVGRSAFEGCNKLTYVSLPDAVTELPENLFCDCTSLRDIETGSISQMGEKAFYNCQSLPAFTLVGTLTSLPRSAFEYCKSMQHMVLPAQVTSIGEKAFHECNALRDIEWSDQLAYIGKQAFDRCFALESITLPDGVTTIPEKAFFECKALRNVQLGNGVRSIDKEAFRRCKDLGSIVLPSSLKQVEKEAFRECTALSEVKFNEGLESLGDNALRETAIQQLDLPASMKKLGKKVAEKCKNLQRIVCRAITPPELDGASNDKIELCVPETAIGAYQNAKNWKKFKKTTTF